MQKYFVWTIDNNVATRVMPQGDVVSVQLSRTDNAVAYEGWWPSEPRGERSILLTGICLWDARWQVEFEKAGRGNPPARRSLALPAEREDVYRRLTAGSRVQKIYYPHSLNAYHDILISWQKEKIDALRPKKVLYHLPLVEYHRFIQELELGVGTPLPVLHASLERFAHNVREKIIDRFGSVMPEKRLEFLETTQSDPNESFLEPYMYPERFGIRREDLVAMEDLVELRLSYEAQKRNAAARPIPALYGVLRIPPPYKNKELTEVGIISLT